MRLCLPLLFLLTSLRLYAVGAAIDVSNQTPEQAKDFVKKTLTKIQASHYEDDDTEGFKYRLNTSWYSPYSFDVFIGTYGDDHKTLVRIDAPNRMGFALGDVLMQENGSKPFAKKYGTKSAILGDTLTLISPTIGYLYVNSYTPFAPKSLWLRPLIYTGIDLLFFWMGAKTFFTHGFDPFDRGKIATAVLLGAFRLWAIIPHHLQIVAHNRMVSLGYSFRF